MKVCRDCCAEKPLSEFYTSGHRDGYTYPQCKACWAARSKVSERANRIRSQYGITHDRFLEIKASQGNACAVCRRAFSEIEDGRGEHIDHDHSCCPGRRSCGKCVRGVLCHSCNTGLGAFGDDLDRLTAAMAYLLQHVNVFNMEVSGV